MKSCAYRFRLWVLERLQPDDGQVMLLLAALVGIAGSLATVGFREVLELSEVLIFGRADGLVATARGLAPWWRVLTPAVGGMLAGWVLQQARSVDKSGAAKDYMEAVTLGEGRIGVRASLLRATSSALSVTSGASIGREAPMVHLAALSASLIGRWRHLPRARLRLLVACGAAAGISTAYNAPIAGALFVAEIVLRAFSFETLGPLIVASVVGNIVSRHFLGFGPLYDMPDFHLDLGWSVGWFSVLGLLSGVFAAGFLALMHWARQGFLGLALPLWAKLGLGGFAVGLISLAEPGVWGNGHSVVNAILAGSWVWQGLVAILLFKTIATALATGSGAVGGAFTPSLFMGAAIGALFGMLLHVVSPQAMPLPAYVAAGMGAFLAACSHAPLMAVVVIFEMTGNSHIIVPLLLACVISVSTKRLLWQASLYSAALPSEHSVSIHDRDGVARLLRQEVPTIAETADCASAETVFLRSRWQHLYVIDGAGRFLGALSLHDFGPYLRTGVSPHSALPVALLRRDFPRIAPDSSLGEMLEAFSRHSGERLPVIDSDGRLQGHLCKTDLMLALQEAVALQA